MMHRLSQQVIHDEKRAHLCRTVSECKNCWGCHVFFFLNDMFNNTSSREKNNPKDIKTRKGVPVN